MRRARIDELDDQALHQLQRTAFELSRCARDWVPEARLLGNLQARELARLGDAAIELIHEEIARRRSS